ncbi:lysyl oxidase-like protein 2/3/4 [Colletotrichum salicis]|uniref:Amine oxidase n=1 Tax=Colletotrichum salicis TaxID=1209931 RepID=A0A135U620_9PEZI|nr:lysyl oxidase-like protein 2/3/4 [Colletotrichum salicis]
MPDTEVRITKPTQRSTEGVTWRKNKPLEKGLATEAVVPSSPTIADEYDVIVIGAGFSGLVADRDLRSTASTLLVEARDRIGGRTWVAKVDGEDVELGGRFVHWHQPHLYNETIRYGKRKYIKSLPHPTGPPDYHFTTNNHTTTIDPLTTASKLEKFYKDFVSVNDTTPEAFLHPPPPLRETRRHQMDVSPQDRPLFEAALQMFGLDRPEETGFLNVARYIASSDSGTKLLEKGGTYSLGGGGTTALARSILAEFTGGVLFRSPVVGISQDGADGRVRVTTRDGRTVLARYVVNTMPLNVLSTITFSPPLSGFEREVVERGHVGRGGKVILALEDGNVPRPFFASAATSAITSSSGCDFVASFHKAISPTDGSVIRAVGFLALSTESPDLTTEASSEKILRSYEALVPEAKVEEYSVHDWRSDPFARGTWACLPAGFGDGKYWDELRRGHGNVVMASGDWAVGWRGFIDGAVEQGVIAAQRVKGLLRGVKV